MPPTSRAPGDKSTHVERPGGSSYTTDVERQIASAISAVGSVVAPRLRAEVGSPEDNLRGPLEVLIRRVGEALGLRVLTHGEASLPELSVRPDYIVDVAEARVGYIELKAPGKGVPGAWSGASAHDRKQWEKLSSLPNVLYTDGGKWALYRSGERIDDVAELAGDLASAGAGLRPRDGRFRRILRSRM
jgi:hypothetical protein